MSDDRRPFEVDVIVVGGGPAGIAAATAAAHSGASAMLIGDEVSRSVALPPAVRSERGNVWGCFAGFVLAVTTPGRTFTVRSKAVVVSTGAYQARSGRSHADDEAPEMYAEAVLARMAGARARLWPETGGWRPVLDAERMSSVAGLFVAGDAAGPCSVDVATLEGRLAGRAAAFLTGFGASESIETVQEELSTLDPLRLWPEMGPGGPASGATGDMLLVCPCEGITAESVEGAIERGAGTINDVKRRTRAGMGECQGRYCTPLIAALIARSPAYPINAVEPMTARPPARPITLAQLASLDADFSQKNRGLNAIP